MNELSENIALQIMMFIIIFWTFIDAEVWGFDDVYKVGNSQSQTESAQASF